MWAPFIPVLEQDSDFLKSVLQLLPSTASFVCCSLYICQLWSFTAGCLPCAHRAHEVLIVSSHTQSLYPTSFQQMTPRALDWRGEPLLQAVETIHWSFTVSFIWSLQRKLMELAFSSAHAQSNYSTVISSNDKRIGIIGLSISPGTSTVPWPNCVSKCRLVRHCFVLNMTAV